jgi:hypothetical protein
MNAVTGVLLNCRADPARVPGLPAAHRSAIDGAAN